MLESRSREVEITDIRLPIFLSFLEYLYSDQIDVSVDAAMDLFVVADRVCFVFIYTLFFFFVD
jgi:hypothetical protein